MSADCAASTLRGAGAVARADGLAAACRLHFFVGRMSGSCRQITRAQMRPLCHCSRVLIFSLSLGSEEATGPGSVKGLSLWLPVQDLWPCLKPYTTGRAVVLLRHSSWASHTTAQIWGPLHACLRGSKASRPCPATPGAPRLDSAGPGRIRAPAPASRAGFARRARTVSPGPAPLV